MPTKSKSERGARSRSRGRSRSRSRSRGRSKSPARTKQTKQTTSPSPSQRSRSATKQIPKTTPTRQSARIKDIEQKFQESLLEDEAKAQEEAKEDKKEKAADVSQSESTSKRESKSAASKYTFGGPVGAFLMTIGLPVVVLAVNLTCSKKSCVPKLPSFPKTFSAYFDKEALLFVVGWIAFQAAFACLPIGKVVKGQPLKNHGKPLSYRCNGFLALLATYAILAAAAFFKHLQYPISVVYGKFFQMSVAAMGLSVLLSVYLFIRSQKLSSKEKSPDGNTGCLSYDFFMGRELNPRIGPLDLKFFFELRPGLIGWTVLNSMFVFKAYQSATLTPALATVAIFQNLYVLDALLLEESILTTLDIMHEGFGFMLAFGDIAWVPFLYCLQTRFLLEHPQTWHPGCIVGFIVLTLIGYIIFRGANSEKDRFKRDPHNPVFANFNKIPASGGKKLLASGWWGLCRHPNYLGDIILAFAWSLPCGFGSPLPYFYPLSLIAILVHRSFRDDQNCRLKYGAAWERYCREVKYRIIPYVF